MRTYTLRLVIIIVAAALVPGPAASQHERHEAGVPASSSAELTRCLHVQPVVDGIITSATARLESARLSNNPAEMRAAIEHLGAALRDIRAQLAPCSAAVAALDPHVDHALPARPESGRPDRR